MAHQCDVKPDNRQPRWYGLELKREVEVVEKYTLGEGRSKAFLTWDKESMDCFRSQGPAHIILFGVNSPQEYQQALALGADGVMVNSRPRRKASARRNKNPAKAGFSLQLQNAVLFQLLAPLRRFGFAFLRASHGSGQSQTFSMPSAVMPPQLPCRLLRLNT